MTTITTAQADHIASLRDRVGYLLDLKPLPDADQQRAYSQVMSIYGPRARNRQPIPEGETMASLIEAAVAAEPAKAAARRAAFATALTAPIDGITKAEASALIDTLKAGV